ncbi:MULTISPECIES: ribosome maturation factor RimP [unclassified Iodidimonas]|jgi:ribosome maturation factor RimP|uniref:ribosome maturation factor RimP n=1 Tax=unclassified Iodidimonas TaxID=2626145 RepID=UPI0024822EB7|nr:MULTISPECIES: ribosome maturation factor RimP [unclassified Iodidimonas]
MDAAQKVRAIIEPTVESMGYELVRVSFGGDARAKLQIMAERPDGTMSVDDCALLSREVSALLDVEDPIPGEYVLEVSSPGIDRPLTRAKDFERWAGFEARIELDESHEGRKRYRGLLLGLVGDQVRLRVDGEDLDIPFDHVHKAKLVMTDDLLDMARRAARD